MSPAPGRLRLVLLLVLSSAALLLGYWVVRAAMIGHTDAVSVSALVVTLVAALFQGLEYFQGTRTAPKPAETLANELAESVTDQWLEEAQARQLSNPGVLPLKWTQTDRDVVDRSEQRPGTRLRLSGELRGDFDDATAALGRRYAQLPSGRVVVLGEPGSGKTVLAMLLVLGLLGERSPGRPVPVLLAASSWDPLSETMEEWVIRSLADAYYGGRPDAPRRLLHRNLLLPIIDGLDEIPEFGRREAVEKINAAIGPNRPVVVTCRTVEFQDLIRAGAPSLKRAAVVEIDPLDPRDVVAHLSEVDWPAGVSWEPVYTHLRTQPSSYVTEALSTPLMVSMARSVYANLGEDPAVLLDGKVLDSRHAIENHITDRVIEAAYPAPEPGTPQPRWPAPVAKRYLTLLARYMHSYGERDFKWWLLSQRLVSPWAPPILGVLGGVALMVAVSLWIARYGHLDPETGLLKGAYLGGAFAVLTTVMWYAVPNRTPGRISLTTRESAVRLRRGFRAGLIISMIPGLPLILGLAAVISLTGTWTFLNIDFFVEVVASLIAIAMVIGAALAVHSWLDGSSVRAAQTTPTASIHADRFASWVGSLAAGVIVGAAAIPGAAVGTIFGTLAVDLMAAWPGWPGRAEVADLSAAWLDDILWIFDDGLMRIGAFVLCGLIFTALVLLTRAWPRFAIVRMLLSLGRELPYDLPEFLADARERGLLRQAAASYQFRHIRLQERLANRSAEAPGEAAHPALAVRPVNAHRLGRRIATAAAAAGALAVVGIVHWIPDANSTSVFAGRHHGGMYGVSASHDGRLIAMYSEYDTTVRIFDLGSGRLLQAWAASRSGVSTVAFNANDSVAAVFPVATFVPGDISVYQVPSGRRLATVPSNSALRFSHDGQLTILGLLGDKQTGSPDMVRVIDNRDGHVLRTIAGTVGYNFAASDEVVLAATDIVPIATSSRTIELWRLSSPAVVALVRTLEGTLSNVETDPSGRYLLLQRDDGVQLWNLAAGVLIATLDPVAGPGAWHFSDDGDRLVTTTGGSRVSESDDDKINIWDCATGRRIAALSGLYSIGTIQIHDGRLLSVAALDPQDHATSIVTIMDVRSGAKLATIPYSRSYDVNVARHAVLTVGGTEGAAMIQRWDLSAPAKPPAELPSPDASEQFFSSIDFGGQSRDGTLTEIRRSHDIEIWNVATTTLLVTYFGDDRNNLFFSPYSDALVHITDESVELLDTNGHRRASLQGLTGGAFNVTEPPTHSRNELSRPIRQTKALAFDPTGRTIATLTAPWERIDVWSAETGRRLYTLTGHLGSIYAFAYSPDGRTIFSAAEDNTVRVWRLDELPLVDARG